MSSCLILQQEDRAFIGADSIICNIVNGKPVRTEYEDNKLFVIGKDIMFCAGNMSIIHGLVDWCNLKYYDTNINIDELSEKLKNEHSGLKSEFSDAEVVISTFRDGKSVVYGLSQYNDYEPIIYKGDPRGVMIITGGIRTKEVYEYAANAISNKMAVVDIYNSIHSGSPYIEIGGQPTLIEHRSNAISYLLKPGKLNYGNKEPSISNYIAADVVYGSLFFGEKLTIQNKQNTFTIDEKGLIGQSANGFKVQINPDDPDNIINISKEGTKLFYIDALKDKLVFAGRAEIDEGKIGGWEIGATKLTSGGVGMSSEAAAGAISFWAGNATPASAPYRLTNQGKLYASNVDITGGSLSIGSNFSVNSAGNLTAKSVNITGGNLNIGNGLFRANSSGVYFGDYYVSADGSGTLATSNGLVNIVDITVDSSGPISEYAKLTIGSPQYPQSVTIAGSGDIYSARFYCRGDMYFPEDAWAGANWGTLRMLKQIYNRLDLLRGALASVGVGISSSDWNEG